MDDSDQNPLITIYAVRSTGEPSSVSVHLFDQVRELYSRLDVSNVSFAFRSCLLVDAMTFAFYDISDGSVINVIEHKVRPPKRIPQFRLRIDTSSPIRVDMDPAMPVQRRELLYRYLTNTFNPTRGEILARLSDRQFDLKEMKGRLFRRICHSQRQLEERELEATERPQSPSIIRNSDEPPVSELPVLWNTESGEHTSDATWKNSIMITLVPYQEYQ